MSQSQSILAKKTPIFLLFEPITLYNEPISIYFGKKKRLFFYFLSQSLSILHKGPPIFYLISQSQLVPGQNRTVALQTIL